MNITSIDKGRKRLVRVEEKTVIDTDGVVKEEEKRKTLYVPQEPPYIKMYCTDISKILGLPGSSKDLLYWLILKMDFENCITITSRYKKETCEKLTMKVQTFDNYLQSFIKAGIFKRIDRGEYRVNPHLFSRGEWQSISKRQEEWWEMKVTYKPDGTRTIEAGFIEPSPSEKLH